MTWQLCFCFRNLNRHLFTSFFTDIKFVWFTTRSLKASKFTELSPKQWELSVRQRSLCKSTYALFAWDSSQGHLHVAQWDPFTLASGVWGCKIQLYHMVQTIFSKYMKVNINVSFAVQLKYSFEPNIKFSFPLHALYSLNL